MPDSPPAKRSALSVHSALALLARLVRVARLEWGILIAVLVAALALYAFVEIAEAVLEGETHAFDARILLALRSAGDPADPLGPPWLEEVVRDITALGGTAVLTLATLVVFGFLAMTGRRRTAWIVAGAVAGGVIVSQTLKWGFDRPRPDLVPHASIVYSQSFPSGHAMMAAVVYLTLGALLARTQVRRRAKLYLIGAAAFVTVLIGVSRVYLGVHWPTDVLAGWAGGAAWALACWLAMLWLQGRGRIEPPRDQNPSPKPGGSNN